MNCRKLLRYFVLLKFLAIFILSISHVLFSNEIEESMSSDDNKLTRKVNLALDLALKKFDGHKIWLIYSIDCQRTTIVDRSSAFSGQGMLTLEEIISRATLRPTASFQKNEKLSQIVYLCSENLTQNPSNNQDLRQSLDTKKSDISSLAIILDYSLESGNPCFYNVAFQKMNQPFIHDMRPIFWLGKEVTSNSFSWLASQFNLTSYPKLKQQIIATIGLHYYSEQADDFLRQVVLNNSFLSLREEALHWLGQHNSTENIRFLAFQAIKQNNIQLRKKAIVALSQIKDKKALTIISALATKEKNQEIRQVAIFWLSQIATDEALKILSEIITKDKSPAIKDYAVFAVSQLPTGKATPILHNIANDNPDARIRKKAQFWLDHTRNQRMLDFFKELVEDGNQYNSN